MNNIDLRSLRSARTKIAHVKQINHEYSVQYTQSMALIAVSDFERRMPEEENSDGLCKSSTGKAKRK